MDTTVSVSHWSARDLAYTALMTAVIAACSWVSVPATVPFTLQTLGVFLAVGLLGGRRGSMAVLVYLLLGAAGAPVFHGFTGGVGILFGATGGYLLGFLGSALLYWALTRLVGESAPVMALAMALGLLVCYAFGTAWFMVVYARTSGPVGLMTALGWCVLPFVIPDLLKLALALSLTRLLRRHIH